MQPFGVDVNSASSSQPKGSYVEVGGTAPNRLSYTTWSDEEDAVVFHWLEDKAKHDRIYAQIKGTGSGASRIKMEKQQAWDEFLEQIYLAGGYHRTQKAVDRHITNMKDRG